MAVIIATSGRSSHTASFTYNISETDTHIIVTFNKVNCYYSSDHSGGVSLSDDMYHPTYSFSQGVTYKPSSPEYALNNWVCSYPKQDTQYSKTISLSAGLSNIQYGASASLEIIIPAYNTINVYNSNGEKQNAIVKVYDDNGNLANCNIYVYDSNGQLKHSI